MNHPNDPYRFFRLLLGLSKKSVIYGDARWMNKSEKKRFFASENTGLILGNHQISLAKSFQHLALVAPTGIGKTTKYVIENILNCVGSIVVTDPSGEIYKKTSGHLKNRGYQINVMQPTDLSRSDRFNALTRFNTPQQIRKIATTLAFVSGGDDPFWTNNTINILYIGLVALSRCDNPAFNTLGNLRWLLNHFGVDGSAIHSFMAEHLDAVTFAEYTAFVAQDSKVLSSIISSARSALDLWSDPDIVELTASNSIDIERFRKEKTITYLIVPEHQIKYFSLILNLFYSACFETFIEMNNTPGQLPIFFFLDEFGNLGKIPEFETVITTLRKQDCSISVILQDLAQLDAIYGDKEAKTIFSGGLVNKLFLSSMGLETCEYLERLLGKNTVYDTESGEASEDNHTHAIAQPLMTADQIRRMHENRGVLVSGRERPASLTMTPYYADSRLIRLSNVPPPVLHFDHAAASAQWIPFDTPSDD